MPDMPNIARQCLELGLLDAVAVDLVPVGTVSETEFGSLTMLKLPDDVFVSLELVHDPAARPVHPAGLNHLVVQVDDLHATVARLSSNAIEAGAPSSPNGSDDFWTAWLTDPDGYRIELVQWPPGHADGLTHADFPGQHPSTTTSEE
jgi:lactoylglutathione lyase